MVHEGHAEVSHADDGDGRLLGQPEGRRDLELEIVDVVSDPTRPVGAELAQILANLGGVDSGKIGQLLGGNRVPAGRGQLDQHPQVQGKPAHRGLGYLALAHHSFGGSGRPHPRAARTRLYELVHKRTNAIGGRSDRADRQGRVRWPDTTAPGPSTLHRPGLGPPNQRSDA